MIIYNLLGLKIHVSGVQFPPRQLFIIPPLSAILSTNIFEALKSRCSLRFMNSGMDAMSKSFTNYTMNQTPEQKARELIDAQLRLKL
jgi:hypothetical protein